MISLRPPLSAVLLAACLPVLAGCAGVQEDPIPVRETVLGVQRGEASWYSVRTNRGTHTASGERLRDESATAAHRTLPMGTRVRVLFPKRIRDLRL